MTGEALGMRVLTVAVPHSKELSCVIRFVFFFFLKEYLHTMSLGLHMLLILKRIIVGTFLQKPGRTVFSRVEMCKL